MAGMWCMGTVGIWERKVGGGEGEGGGRGVENREQCNRRFQKKPHKHWCSWQHFVCKLPVIVYLSVSCHTNKL